MKITRQKSILFDWKSLKSVSFLVFSISTLNCLTEQVNAATFFAEINNFNLVMPPVITNAFAFTLSRGTELNTDPRGQDQEAGNAQAFYTLFTIRQTRQPSGLRPPFSDIRFGREITGGSAVGFALPTGNSSANSQAVLFGRLGNGTVLLGNPQDIPLTFDLSFDYKLEATANLARENASASYEVTVTGLGNPDANCNPLSLSIVANDSTMGSVTCTFSTILAAGEFRDFNIQVKVAGAAESKNNPPPPPPPPPPIPPDISVPIPEPASTLGLLAFGTLGIGATLKRKLKSSKFTAKETTKIG